MNLSWEFPYPSQRMPIFAENIVATSQPLAVQAGISMLQCGGNAVDAALAAAITLTVVEPTGCGLGGDAFAIVWDGGQLYGLNGSGRAPRKWSIERFDGLDEMPRFGWDSITVPGAVDVWRTLSDRFGNLHFEQLFEPAIHYACKGFPVSPLIAKQWAGVAGNYIGIPEFADAFLPGGQPPCPGQLFRLQNQAKSLESIAKSRAESFYRGELADRISEYAKQAGAALTRDDLAAHRSEWVSPIIQPYRGIHVCELPPNGQGLAAIIALGILRYHPLAGYPVDSADSIHLQVEAMKCGFAEAYRHICDPDAMSVSPNAFLSEDYLLARAESISMSRAQYPQSNMPRESGTVYIAAADKKGMMVSFIQSNFQSFGSGIVVPGTGISFHNRGYAFSLDSDHPNLVEGGKRPYHTIIPGFVMKNGQPLMSFGVMGGQMQAQAHVQLITRTYDYGQNPQTACDAPRWFLDEKFRLALEPGFNKNQAADLEQRGHSLIGESATWGWGGAQLIYKFDSGYCGASDHRKDGFAAGF